MLLAREYLPECFFAGVLYPDTWSLVLPLDAMSEVLGLTCHRGVKWGGDGKGLAPASRAGEKEGREREQTGSRPEYRRDKGVERQMYKWWDPSKVPSNFRFTQLDFFFFFE